MEDKINFLNRNDFVQQLMSMFSCSLAKVSHAITMVDLWISGMENRCYHSLVALRLSGIYRNQKVELVL